MQKAEAQQAKVQSQPATKQGGGMAVKSPQSEQIAQLEAMMDSSPSMARMGNMAAMMSAAPVTNSNPARTAQLRMMDMVANAQQHALQRRVEMIRNSPEQLVAQKFSDDINNSPVMVQRRKKMESLFGVAQRVEDEEALQGKFAAETPAQLEQQPAVKSNNTGLPDNLKAGIENLSGMSMDGVKVHYNSSQPAQLNALAYAQGTDIHVAPGQEQHLPHEAWHVVQQAQGRVLPTLQMKDGVPVNDNAGLEREADVMGGKAFGSVQLVKQENVGMSDLTPVAVGHDIQQKQGRHKPMHNAGPNPLLSPEPSTGDSVAQRVRIKLDHANDPIMNNVRAAQVPNPGSKMVDGFTDYDPSHAPIKMNENIILEGHGTYLNPVHALGAPYDSQAELEPQQLANVAFMVPKPKGWNGQIILFGCATGSLAMKVSQHYLALFGKSVNVVGTLADIRMEVPSGPHKEHHAEYDEVSANKYPKAPSPSVSARTQFRIWLEGARSGALEAMQAIIIYNEIKASNRDEKDLTSLINGLTAPLMLFRHSLATELNYEGRIYNSNITIKNEMLRIRVMLNTANDRVVIYMLKLNDSSSDERGLDEDASSLCEFFYHLLEDLQVLENMTNLAEKSVPKGTVDWEGENVVNSKADKVDGLPTVPLLKDKLTSKNWGGGSGAMLTHGKSQGQV